jgi:hypothetical protein
MADSDRAALCELVMRTRKNIALVRPLGNILTLSVLSYEAKAPPGNGVAASAAISSAAVISMTIRAGLRKAIAPRDLAPPSSPEFSRNEKLETGWVFFAPCGS